MLIMWQMKTIATLAKGSFFPERSYLAQRLCANLAIMEESLECGAFEIEVVSAVESLYDDELKPVGRILRKRVAERTSAKPPVFVYLKRPNPVLCPIQTHYQSPYRFA